ncbi:MAG TPA: DUF5615 family PIN-like protein [Anaerolineaceae bacterium]|nr:DUF5615 family PIN-like protein [Anaerolineaceae bacterium]
MTEPKLHLDADASQKALWSALIACGHDVSRTPASGLPLDASDEFQLFWAAGQGRVLFSFSVRDFMILARRYPQHGGIVLAHQRQFLFSGIVTALGRMLSETEADDWPGQVRWLSDWR